MPEPGAEQDELSRNRWLERVRTKHRFLKFAPPFASCFCRGWQLSAPGDMGAFAQRDYLLDGFLAHQKFMRAEKKRLLNYEAR